jgi:hypothetical protein
VDPVLGREVVEGEQRLEVVDDLGDRLGPLGAELVSELVGSPHGVGAVFSVADLGQHSPGRRLGGLRQALMTLATLCTSCRIRH